MKLYKLGSWLGVIATAVVLAGCGTSAKITDEELSAPELTTPNETYTTPPVTTYTVPEDETMAATQSPQSSSGAAKTGGTSSNDAEGTTDAPVQSKKGAVEAPTQKKAPDGGIPSPETGSPADRFEEFCKDNPGACE